MNPTSGPGAHRLQAPVIILLAAWLGVTLFTWFSAGVTFDVLSVQKNPELSKRFEAIPNKKRERALRHAAGEVNRKMFRGWNMAQLALGVLILLVFIRARRERSPVELALAGVLLAVVLAHAFWLGPGIERTGRALDFAAPGQAAAARRLFGLYHGIYIVSDLLKAALLAWALWRAARGTNPDRLPD